MPHACRSLGLIVALAILAGCASPSSTTGAAKRARPGDRVTPGASPVEVGASGASPGAVSPDGLPASPPVGMNPPIAIASPTLNLATASLSGKILAPASIIANNGGGLISDMGGGIVSNNSGNYRLAETGPAQVPVGGARVEVLDAAGNPVQGPDGQPLVTTATADGTYAFSAPLPGRHVVLRATPPGASNGLSRLVASGLKTADVDWPSTLVAGYVLASYVNTQPDRQATLDKLPAAVEAETVAKAAAAIAAGTTGTSLAPAAVVAAAEGLRSSDTSFNTQMDVVKRILIAAGVASLGAGLPATEVYLRRVFESDVAADGAIYTYCADDHLIWGVGADGKLAPKVGNGESPASGVAASRAGLKATDFALDYVMMLRVDATGRPVVSEMDHGIWRREPDGTITELHAPAALKAAFGQSYLARGIDVRDDGTLVTLVDEALWALTPGGSKSRLADAAGVRVRSGFAELPGGGRWLARDGEVLVELAAGSAPKTLFAADDARIRAGSNGIRGDVALDHRGNFFYVAASDQQLHQRHPDGTDTIVGARSSLSLGIAWVIQGADGKVYVADCDLGDNLGGAILRRFTGGTGTVVAGIDGLPKGFTAAGQIALLYPKGLEVAPDGMLWVADAGALLEIKPGGAPTAIGTRNMYLPDGFETVQFSGVRRQSDGTLLARAFGKSFEYVLRRQADGSWKKALSTPRTYGNDWNIAFHAWDVAPDGTIVTSHHAYNNATNENEAKVFRLKPGETTPTTLVPISAGFDTIAKLGFAPDGTLWMRAAKRPPAKGARYKVAPDGTVTEGASGVLAAEAADAAGRLYEGDAPTFTLGNFGDRHIRRQAPGGAAEVFAGSGTALLGGTALDDSIGWAEDLRFDAAGNMYVRDVLRRQVRRIPKERL